MKKIFTLFAALCLLCATNAFAQSIVLTQTAPTIDGSIDAVWADATAFTINKTALGDPTNMPAGSWRVMTDNVNLYYLIEITDNNKFGNTQAGNYWNGDAIEIYIASGNGTVANQIGFAYVSNTGVMLRYGKTDTGGSFFMKDTPTGYLLEASLPLAYFGIGTLTTTSTVKLELGVNQGQNGSRLAQLNTFNNSTEHRNTTDNYGNVSVTGTDLPPAPTVEVTIQALGGKTNLNSNGSNFAALIVKSITANVGTLREKTPYLWEVNTGSGYATYSGKNYNNNNIRPTKAGTYRCTVYNTAGEAFVSNEIVITANAAAGENFESNLPIIVVYTGSKQFPSPQGGCGIPGSGYADKTKIDVDVKILWNEQGGANRPADLANNASVYYDRKARMNYRGSTSRSMIKRSYAFSTAKKDILANGSLEKGKVDLFGLPEEKDWILYSAYNDKSMMRNKLAFDLYRQFGHYASSTRYVELFVNDVYQGVYILLEKYEENDNRINITTEEKLTAAGKTNIQPEEMGYIMKFDKTTPGDPLTWVRTPALLGGMSGCGNAAGCGIASDAQGWELVYPEVASDNDPRKNYIRNWLAQFEIALKAASTTQQWDALFETYIDVPSFVDFMIINELSRNTDGYRASMWFVKDAAGKLKCTPIWDFEMGFGNDDKYPALQGVRQCSSTTNAKPYATDIWQYNTNECEPYYPLPFWYAKLMENQCFRDIFRTRWEALRATALSPQNIENELERNSSDLNANGALAREKAKWSWEDRNACPCEDSYAYCPWMITRWEANYRGVGNPAGKTTAWNYEYKLLQAWIDARLAWMDSQIGNGSFGTALTAEQFNACAKMPDPPTTATKPAQADNGISITADNRQLNISAREAIQSVSVYDTKGILLAKKTNVDAQSFTLPLPATSSLLVVSVATATQSASKVVPVK